MQNAHGHFYQFVVPGLTRNPALRSDWISTCAEMTTSGFIEVRQSLRTSQERAKHDAQVIDSLAHQSVRAATVVGL